MNLKNCLFWQFFILRASSSHPPHKINSVPLLHFTGQNSLFTSLLFIITFNIPFHLQCRFLTGNPAIINIINHKTNKFISAGNTPRSISG